MTARTQVRPELVVAFPDAKVIHTERPEEAWWASYSATIGKFFEHRQSLTLPPPVAEIFETMDTLLIKGVMGGLDKHSAVAACRRNNEKVRATIPAERLPVFTPSDGRGPLCAFLGVDVPDSDFPRSNARSEFWELFGGGPAAAYTLARPANTHLPFPPPSQNGGFVAHSRHFTISALAATAHLP